MGFWPGKGEPHDYVCLDASGARRGPIRRAARLLRRRARKAAEQAAVREERTWLAGEIHDGLAQSFTAICMQLGVAEQELSSKEDDPISRIQRTLELAIFGFC